MSRIVSKETSRSEQVADVKGPLLRFLYLFLVPLVAIFMDL